MRLPVGPAASASAVQSRQLAPQTTHKKRVCVYNGPGAGMRSALSAQESLKRELLEDVEVSFLSSSELLSGSISPRTCALLVFPGGADLPYCRELNGKGNQIIQDYVSSGGSYLGLCAGAYYACSRVEFEEGDPVLEVMGDRELGFFPGTAVGSAYKGFDYTSEAGAKAAPVCFVSSYHHQQGNRLISADQQGTHTAQESTEEAAPWQLSPIFFKAEDWSGAKAGTTSPNSIHDCSMNDGRGGNTHGNGNNTIDGIYKHVSSNHENSWNNDSREVDRPSLHTNVCASRYDRASQSSGTLAGSSVQGVGNASLPSGWSRCLDYCNGGCVFRLPTQSPSRLHMHHSQQGAQHSQQGVQHSQQGVQHSQQGVQHSQQGVQHSQQGEQHSQEGVQHSQQGEQHSQEGVQHSQQGDGHPGSSSQGAEGAEEHDKHLTVLALYEDMQSPAAVRCRVGAGVAVLCGTHPELEPHWLERAAAAAVAPSSTPGLAPVPNSAAPGANSELQSGEHLSSRNTLRTWLMH
eukprot:CAMPEP_0202422564 /NCGR_PEP_ID=MMETSP1128-20130828/50922_1 /ASSEMBLY_ACC=CAM_ASM_000463 /TAXON_ID=3047 /ORGANISM="Dunaliella tertiolecta, Strain CCMP1320" /LENGTH=517 /DNA_ID=CAMNT_0049030627 /DNA_START=1489 /DNA_END=3043 /DNA_ORIENTATION=+